MLLKKKVSTRKETDEKGAGKERTEAGGVL